MNWDKINNTKEVHILISKIADRAIKTSGRKKIQIVMDLEAVHNTTPLRLNELLVAPEFDFIHDIVGIHTHLNRDTGELGDCFLPRYIK